MAELKSDLAPISLMNINEGAVVQGFDIELRRALENIADLNTPATGKRTVTLELTFKPHSDRVIVETEFRVKSKLAGIETHKSKIFLGRVEEGGLVAFDSDPRQMPLWSPPKPERVAETIEFRTGTDKDKKPN